MWKPAIPAVLVAVTMGHTAPAAAQGRPSSTAMTCARAAGLVRARGAIVLGTGGQTYDRFVRDRSFCEPTEYVRPAFAPTRDSPACAIGYTCYEPGRRGFFWDD